MLPTLDWRLTIKLIMHRGTSSSLTVLWKDNRLPTFKPTHGLRKGDLLSAFVHPLHGEALYHHMWINHNGSWHPIQAPKNSSTYLTYCLSVKLFSSPRLRNPNFDSLLTNLFESFCCASRLNIYLAKSMAFYFAGDPHAKIHHLTSITYILNTSYLYKYLSFLFLKGSLK